jgi:hypothetical protein
MLGLEFDPANITAGELADRIDVALRLRKCSGDYYMEAEHKGI